jgi:ribosomal protein S18 acetylase RimI-like enzyme
VLFLRKFEPRDDASLVSWLRTPEELYLFTGPRLRWPLDIPQLDGLRADESFTQFTAELEGTAVGHIELVSTGEGQARVARVLVAPELQGRGLGEQLVRAVLAEARARGIHSLTLFVLPDNARAIALYEKVGFEHRGPSEQLHGALLMELRDT